LFALFRNVQLLTAKKENNVTFYLFYQVPHSNNSRHTTASVGLLTNVPLYDSKRSS